MSAVADASERLYRLRHIKNGIALKYNFITFNRNHLTGILVHEIFYPAPENARS